MIEKACPADDLVLDSFCEEVYAKVTADGGDITLHRGVAPANAERAYQVGPFLRLQTGDMAAEEIENLSDCFEALRGGAKELRRVCLRNFSDSPPAASLVSEGSSCSGNMSVGGWGPHDINGREEMGMAWGDVGKKGCLF